MNQGKLEVVKQEMARVNIDIPGISELKWTRMGEFNSEDHYIYYCGQDSPRKNGIGPMNCSTLGLPVHHQLPEFTQTHVHRVGDAI